MRRGFTLIELIIVIGLIALVGGLIVVNAQAILRGLGAEPVDRILQKAVREARFQAAYLKESTELRFSDEQKSFLILGANGGNLASFNTGAGNESTRLEVEFEQILPEQGLMRAGAADTAPIEAVTFRPDRSSTPFLVRVYEGPRQFTLRFDPFSDIVIDDSREQ